MFPCQGIAQILDQHLFVTAFDIISWIVSYYHVHAIRKIYMHCVQHYMVKL
jgi:hypothetical protein